MSNKKLKPNEIEVLREKAVKSVAKHKKKQKKASELFGFSPTSMSKYIVEYENKGEDSLKDKIRLFFVNVFSGIKSRRAC